MSVYVAASSADIDRAERWITALQDAGITVESTWPTIVRNVGATNPRSASKEQRASWSRDDLRELRVASIFWFLVPPIDMPTRGAWIEFGVATENALHVVASGDCPQSIFLALGEEYATDEEAFAAIVRMAASKDQP